MSRASHITVSGRRVDKSIHAFTLIELLVVIAIIALLVGILLPALGEARRGGQIVQSIANARSCGMLNMTYQSENNGQFINPFAATPVAFNGGTLPTDWVWVPDGRYGVYGWPYGSTGSTSQTESYGYHWIAHTLYSDKPDVSRLQFIVAPGDKALASWFKTNQAAQTDLEWIFPSSYWYPPTFWQAPSRFGELLQPATAANRFLVRRHKDSDVVNPSAKVLVFEGKDYASPKQPMWNDTSARTVILACDGSGQRVQMSKLILQTAATGNGVEPGKIDRPSGLWSPGAGEMNWLEYGASQGFNWTFGNPAYFWRTRGGITGRDLLR